MVHWNHHFDASLPVERLRYYSVFILFVGLLLLVGTFLAGTVPDINSSVRCDTAWIEKLKQNNNIPVCRYSNTL